MGLGRRLHRGDGECELRGGGGWAETTEGQEMSGDALMNSSTIMDEYELLRLAVPGAARDSDEAQKLSICFPKER